MTLAAISMTKPIHHKITPIICRTRWLCRLSSTDATEEADTCMLFRYVVLSITFLTLISLRTGRYLLCTRISGAHRIQRRFSLDFSKQMFYNCGGKYRNTCLPSYYLA